MHEVFPQLPSILVLLHTLGHDRYPDNEETVDLYEVRLPFADAPAYWQSLPPHHRERRALVEQRIEQSENISRVGYRLMFGKFEDDLRRMKVNGGGDATGITEGKVWIQE